MSAGSLFLHPVDATACCPRERLIDALARMGMIAAPVHTFADGGFYVGDRFLQLITFMGCSPHIALEPPAGGTGDFCHVLIHVHDTPRLLTGANTRPPRCPACRKAITIATEAPARLPLTLRPTCSHCGADLHLDTLKWRRDAGFGQLFVEIRSVFPGEAVPVHTLLEALAGTTDCPWDYFYLTSPSGGQIESFG